MYNSKKLLMNMKSIRKKELAGEKKARMGTGEALVHRPLSKHRKWTF
jgi:hypothetical protein